MIRVSRSGFKLAGAAVAFRVVVDGDERANLRLGQTAEVQVQPGDHGLRVTMGRYGSGEWRVELEDGQVAKFRCQPSGWAFQRFPERDLYLTLEPLTDD